MQTNLGSNFFRQGGHLSTQECAYTEGECSAFDAPFSVFVVVLEARQGILDLIIERFHPL